MLHHQHRQALWLVCTPHLAQREPTLPPAQTELQPRVCYASVQKEHSIFAQYASSTDRAAIWCMPYPQTGESCGCNLVCSVTGHKTTLQTSLPEGPKAGDTQQIACQRTHKEHTLGTVHPPPPTLRNGQLKYQNHRRRRYNPDQKQ